MNSRERIIPAEAINLIGFSLLEPSDGMQLFSPTWFNVWEASLHQKAGKKAGRKAWMFKRFGVGDSLSPAQAIRKANYRDWLNSMSDACEQAIAQLGKKGAFRLRNEKNALLYVDSWGETSFFEGVNSWRDALSVDILPKNIVRDYGIKDFTGKIRGERNALMSALQTAQDCLNSGLADNVIICGMFRSFPVLALSEIAGLAQQRGGQQDNYCQFSIERIGCLILKKAPGQGIALNISEYFPLPVNAREAAQKLNMRWQDYIGTNTRQIFSVSPPSKAWRQLQTQAFETLPSQIEHAILSEDYGDSGCLNPALAWQHLLSHDSQPGHSLLNVLDGKGGVWLLENWSQGENQ